MKILLSGGRAPYTLELLRILSSQGHEIHILEFIKGTLCEFSNRSSKTHLITSPNKSFSNFETELNHLIKLERFDLFIPTCEEVIHLAKIKQKIEKYTTLFTSDFEAIIKLHDKELFVELLMEKGLPTPRIYKNKEELLDSSIYILKNKRSRSGGHVKYLKGHQIKERSILKEQIIQQRLTGTEYCLYLIVVKGRITARSLYSKLYCIEGGAANYFEATENEFINQWSHKFFADTSITGQFSFDLFIENENVYAIECNPRTTSGIHLLRNHLQIDQFIRNDQNIVTPPKNAKYMLALPLLIFSFNLKNIINLSKIFISSKDVIFCVKDIKPYLGQFISLFKFIGIAYKHKISLMEATTIDIEYN